MSSIRKPGSVAGNIIALVICFISSQTKSASSSLFINDEVFSKTIHSSTKELHCLSVNN